MVVVQQLMSSALRSTVARERGSSNGAVIGFRVELVAV